MKINLLFHSLSITKVISTACLLILIISATHILNVISIYNNQTKNYAAISSLIELKYAAHNFLLEVKYTQHSSQSAFEKLSPFLIQDKLTHHFFDVAEINKSHETLKDEYLSIQKQLSNFSRYRLEYRLFSFVENIDVAIKQYQSLLKKESNLITASELIAFFLIAFCSLV
ncbi:hypothetical protein N8878_01460, partial [Psychromonas sp.]|nr:hypothetical protein [Psychromonas sp.]